MAGLLRTKSARILTIVLLLQAAAFYGFSRNEKTPAHRPLEEFSLGSHDWLLVQNVDIDKEELDVLKADDLLSRIYQNRKTGRMATVFVAYFETQRTGKAPHSPKNCLPGSGWVPSQSGTVDIRVPGEPEPIHVNRYIVAHGDNQDAVLYWYQSHNRVIASEYAAKIFTVTDSIRYNRSDTSLVRVIVPVQGGNAQDAVDAAVSFVQDLFEPLKAYLPA
jgi:EpsI family protein